MFLRRSKVVAAAGVGVGVGGELRRSPKNFVESFESVYLNLSKQRILRHGYLDGSEKRTQPV